MKEILNNLTDWEAPAQSDTMKYGDMPGDKVTIADAVVQKANVVFKELLIQIPNLLEQRSNERIVIAVSGGSGVGKSGIASLISYYFEQLGIHSYTLSGDNYPRRIPMYNDAERFRIFRTNGIHRCMQDGVYTKERFEVIHKLQMEGQDANPEYCKEYPFLASYQAGGREGLKGYLGTLNELDFEDINRIIAQFHLGQERIFLKRMGREDTELWYDEISFPESAILVLEWTHGNSDWIEGVDLPILLNSTPQETLRYRMARSRDGQTDSPFTTMVLEIEQELLDSQAHKAKIILSKQGELLTYEQYREVMAKEKGGN